MLYGIETKVKGVTAYMNRQGTFSFNQTDPMRFRTYGGAMQYMRKYKERMCYHRPSRARTDDVIRNLRVCELVPF